MRLGHFDHEVLGVIWVDKRHKVIEYMELFIGTIDGASSYPREVVKAALEKNAAACVLVHNHPSGEASPSHADESITRRLNEALGLINVQILDHLIVGGKNVSCFAESELL